MLPLKNKPSTRPVTLEDLREASASSPNANDRINSILQRIQAEEQRELSTHSSAVIQEQVVSQNYSTTEGTSVTLPETSTESYEVATSIFTTTANEERISTAPQDLQVGEATQAVYAEVTRAIDESQVSFWDPIMGFFFGSTLAGLATIGFIIGGSFFMFRGRLNRETVSRALSFFRNNRLLSSAIFGGGTAATTTLITRDGSFNWIEFQRRVQVFITWVSAQNVSSFSRGIPMPSIFTKKDTNNTKKDGKDEESDKDIKDPFSGV